MTKRYQVSWYEQTRYYTVIEAESEEEALKLWEDRKHPAPEPMEVDHLDGPYIDEHP